MGAGKSTWVKKKFLEQYVLSADEIRLLFQTPVMLESGKLGISAKNDGRVWKLLFELLEERMKRGEFTIIDATHAKQEMISQYKALAQEYRYRVSVVDFSDVPLETLLYQNKMRDEHKHVPEHVIMNAHERMQTEHVPKWVTLLKPDEYDNAIKFTESEYDNYDCIHHIGDVQGCFDATMDYFKSTGHEFNPETGYPYLKENDMYIFIGDMLDRGVQNGETLRFFLNIYNRRNVAILEGNHEIHLWKWASDDETLNSKEFIHHTKPQLEEGLSEEEIVELKKETRQLYRKLRQIVYYTRKGKEVVVTHGGLAKMPSNFMYMATQQFINGVGDYEVDIDNAWDKNLPCFPKIYAHGGRGNVNLTVFNEEYKAHIYQIHGHRNIFRLPVQASETSFNLEGQVEFGGYLRSVTLTDEGFQTYEIKNNVFKIRKGNTPKTMNEKDIDMKQFIQYLSNHKEINEKDLGGNIYSYNFTRDAFTDKIWDDINIKARGLFINKNTEQIVSRSYNKFFNVNERSFTKLNALADNLVFPVQVYNKPNGYLGTVGYDAESSELIFTSKSSTTGDHAEWFKELFHKTFEDSTILFIKDFLEVKNASLVFEVILTEKDPHIIEYTEDKLVLLDIVKRQVTYEKLPYEDVVWFADVIDVERKQLVHTFDNWTEMYYWYRDVTTDMSIEDEGFVIEDSIGFMTKIKLPYYNFWKQFRGIKDKFAKRHEHTVKGASLYTPLHNKVFKWMKEQDGSWLKENDIITVRKAYERE